jgi:NAD(P)-dependent dehydrogenase (short-subunit alcohol dehydrogenase family)
MRLKGKVALVTGGGRGIGRAIVEAFAMEGAIVAINFNQHKEGALAAMESIRSRNGKAIIVQADVSSEESVQGMVDQVVGAYESIDILVNNAGVNSPTPFLKLTASEFKRIMEINVTGLFYVSQAVAKLMIARGKGGSILNVSSLVAQRPFSNMAHYNASKGAVSMLTQSMALELSPYKIRVNEICPASVETDMLRVALQDPKNRNHRLETIPLGRIGQPEDLAGAAIFLCSDEASWVTGASLVTDGGLSVIPPFGRPS